MLKKFILIATFFLQVHAGPEHIEAFLQEETSRFDSASTAAEKFAIVSMPVNLTYLKGLPSGAVADRAEIRRGVSADVLDNGKGRINYDKSNIFMIAISWGRVDLVSNFLTAVDDINDPRLYAWGYRQPYSPAHMAMDPGKYPQACVSSENQLRVIDLVGKAGADFNFIFLHNVIGIYENPPLAAGTPSGSYLPEIEIEHRRALALLYGVDPRIEGSSFRPIEFASEHNKPLFNLAFKLYCDRMRSGNVDGLRPIPELVNHFKKVAKQVGGDEAVAEFSALLQQQHVKPTTQIHGKDSPLEEIERAFAEYNQFLSTLPTEQAESAARHSIADITVSLQAMGIILPVKH